MTKIAIIVGHPRTGSFCEALGDAYAEGARSGGHAVTVIKLSGLAFDPVLRHGFAQPQPLEADLVPAQAAIGAAEHTVWIWPLWLGFPPALLKGFLERILTDGFAFEKVDGPPFYKPLLTGHSARVIVTMQMPAWMFRLMAGARAARTFSKQVLGFVGMRPVRRTYFGMVEHVGDAKRRRWLDAVKAMGRRAQ
jgi:putative NADPH-quinone reductase